MIEGSESAIVDALGLTPVAALAFLMFNLFTPPCFAAIGAMNAELKSKKWLFGALGLQLSVGYSIGFLVFFFGTLLTDGSLGDTWMPILGWMIEAGIISVFAFLIVKKNKEIKENRVSSVKEKANV